MLILSESCRGHLRNRGKNSSYSIFTVFRGSLKVRRETLLAPTSCRHTSLALSSLPLSLTERLAALLRTTDGPKMGTVQTSELKRQQLKKRHPEGRQVAVVAPKKTGI